MSGEVFDFTVFTPTFNRRHTLRRVYESLVRQKYDRMEWLVVDDGSTDDTRSLLQQLAEEAPFAVRLQHQENRGKHVAHNRAVAAARGQLTIVLDSDDELLGDALSLLWNEWTCIVEPERSRYAGIVAHSVDASGALLGKPFPTDVVDGHYLDLVASGLLVGDKLPCYRTDLLREYPFPGEEQRGVVPEGTVWCRIGSRRLLRCVNRAVLRVHRHPADRRSLTAQSRQSTGARGRRLYALAILDEGRRHFPRHSIFLLRHAAMFVSASLHERLGVRRQYRDLPGALARTIWFAAVPLGIAMWIRDRWQAHGA